MDDTALRQLVHERLAAFHQARLSTLVKLDLKKPLQQKNPYLFRAIGVTQASEVVAALLGVLKIHDGM